MPTTNPRRNGAPVVPSASAHHSHGSLGQTADTPMTVYLPFNIDCLKGGFVPAKRSAGVPEQVGRWLIVQNQGLLVPDAGTLELPYGPMPAGLNGACSEPIWLGCWDGVNCFAASLKRDAPVPEGLRRETLVPMEGTSLPDPLLSLGGMAMQALHWESTSGYCPRCGTVTARIANEWGKRCPNCRYEHYPHLYPAVIVLIHDGDRVLLARKNGWAPNRYALVAGFVDNGESLESAVRREVSEEVGVEVSDIQYVGSQNWPFPSQLMVGFLARYAGGEITVDHDELEDARWFPRDELPNGPSRHSIAGFIIENYARRRTPPYGPV